MLPIFPCVWRDKIPSTEQNLARVELHKESLEREAEELAQIKEDLTVELAAVQKEKEIQVLVKHKEMSWTGCRISSTYDM